ncbi:hypothetical protein RRG08_020917 [Elysia crispata]|uniref:ZP domain-containing protein n=1 Tax=Elysia crispata TaxID=231223 RepID=A0AAE1AG99_9GAST|nr:hypothetical protein RRG08_020917 [Elysia crispata]
MTLLLTSLISPLASASSEAITQCIYNERVCGCDTEDGVISLEKYRGKTFSAADPDSSRMFHWSPCDDITMGAVTASCVLEVSPVETYNCGTHKSVRTSVRSGEVLFHMTGNGYRPKLSLINCVCEPQKPDVFKFHMEGLPGVFVFGLNGDSCCPKANNATVS